MTSNKLRGAEVTSISLQPTPILEAANNAKKRFLIIEIKDEIRAVSICDTRIIESGETMKKGVFCVIMAKCQKFNEFFARLEISYNCWSRG